MESHGLHTLLKYRAGKLVLEIFICPFFSIPVMPYNSAHHCVVEVENFLFVLGGEDQWNPNGNYWTVLIIAALYNSALCYYNEIPKATHVKEKRFTEFTFWEVQSCVLSSNGVSGWWPTMMEWAKSSYTINGGRKRERIGRMALKNLGPPKRSTS